MACVLVVDDQAIVCEGLRVVLSARPGLEVVMLAHGHAQANAVAWRAGAVARDVTGGDQ